MSTPRRARPSEHFGNHALPAVNMRREADHLDDHLVAGRGAAGAGVANGDGIGKQLPVDFDVGPAAGLEVRAHELVRLALDDLDDFAPRAGVAP